MPDLEVTCSRCGSKLHHECHPETVAEAALDFFMWRPESGFPKALKKGNDWVDERVDDESIPFFSEAYLYALLGKEDARTFMALIGSIFRAMGIEPRHLEEKADELLAKKKRDRAEEKRLRAEARERYRQQMLPVETAPQLGEMKGLALCTYSSFYCFDVNVDACESGNCFERYHDEGRRKEPKLSALTRTTEGEMRVTCKLCKRTHRATVAQVEGWKGEKRYQCSPKKDQNREPPMRPQDWIAADCVREALGFKRD